MATKRTVSRSVAEGQVSAGSVTRTMAPDLRRRELMDAGERVLLDKGFSLATVDDITRSAGVAKGTFYLYFDSKQALVTALRERFIEGCRERIDAFAARLPVGDWGGRLDAWVEGGICHYLDHLELHDVIFHAGQEERGSMAQSALVTEFADLIRAGAGAQAWRVDNPELMSLFLFFGLHGIVDHIATSRRADRTALIRLGQKIVRNALGLSSEAARRAPVKRS